MKTAELTKRLDALEKAVAELQAKVNKTPDPTSPWWEEGAGRFKDDPVFEEIVRLGREYRESLRPKPKKRKPKRVRP